MTPTPRVSPLPPILHFGFLSTLSLWLAWFFTHLPWLGVKEPVALAIVLIVWTASLIYCGYRSSPDSLRSALGAGILAAVLGLLILGSKLTDKSLEQHASLTAATVKPNAGLIAIGFIGLGGLLGLVGGSIGRLLTAQRALVPAPRHDYLPHFALVTLACAAPLLFVGGLVTSTNSGMAVPDWPNTYGSNMFLYPIGPRASGSPDMPASKIFLEHSHRLFGTLVGLASLTLLIWTLLSKRPKGVKILAGVAFALVAGQGILGGVRVLRGAVDAASDNRFYSFAHGVLGQICFAVLVILAVRLFAFDRPTLNAEQHPIARRVRFLATFAFHASILQLVLGAAFRHFRHAHILWSHIAFALLVTGVGVIAGYTARTLTATDRASDATRRIGMWVAILVKVQFVLGWGAFLLGYKNLEASNAAQAIVRTLHQANGAAMLGVITALWCLARTLSPRERGA